MIAYLYRWRIQAGLEDEFRQAWRELTCSIYETSGSLGSRLHRTPDGSWVAYALWPSRELREASRARGASKPEAAARMRACTEAFEELELTVVDDLLMATPFTAR